MMKKTLSTISSFVQRLIARKISQKFFEALYQFSLFGMNIGGGGDVQNSGEVYVLEFIRSIYKSSIDLIIFDVGANIGDYSLLLKKTFNRNATVYAFEPSLITFNRLRDNLRLQSGINLYNIGLGNENTKTFLYTNEDLSGMASVYRRRLDHVNLKMNKQEAVGIKTLDNFCSIKNIAHIHLLKLDVEGHELRVLEGASNMLRSGSIDFIQFEFGSANIDSRTFFQDFYYLLKDDYNIYRIVKNGLYPIKRYRDMYEIFIPANYLAQKKYLKKS